MDGAGVRRWLLRLYEPEEAPMSDDDKPGDILRPNHDFALANAMAHQCAKIFEFEAQAVSGEPQAQFLVGLNIIASYLLLGMTVFDNVEFANMPKELIELQVCVKKSIKELNRVFGIETDVVKSDEVAKRLKDRSWHH